VQSVLIADQARALVEFAGLVLGALPHVELAHRQTPRAIVENFLLLGVKQECRVRQNQ
jgi:hypothetical protein